MENPIYQVTERNVDGCGGDATEYVRFLTGRPLDGQEAGAFRQELESVKRAAAAGTDSSTSDMIETTLELFGRKTGIHGETVLSPFAGSFEF